LASSVKKETFLVEPKTNKECKGVEIESLKKIITWLSIRDFTTDSLHDNKCESSS